jgi:putative transposase
VLAAGWTRRGYRFLTMLLRREGCRVNHKRVYRLYREEGLAVRRRRRRRKQMAEARRPVPPPSRLNECWGMDFVSDGLVGGRRVRILNIVDGLSREDLDGPIDTSLPARRVIEALDRIALERGEYPVRIIVDNGPEFRSREMDAWAYGQGVELAFIDPGKPIQNPITESYNGRMRDECLNVNHWSTLEEACAGITTWRRRYNTERPHGSLGNRTPAEYAAYKRALSDSTVAT